MIYLLQYFFFINYFIQPILGIIPSEMDWAFKNRIISLFTGTFALHKEINTPYFDFYYHFMLPQHHKKLTKNQFGPITYIAPWTPLRRGAQGQAGIYPPKPQLKNDQRKNPVIYRL